MSNLDNNDFTISTTNSNPPHIHEQVATYKLQKIEMKKKIM
jgi:hypothetical protein